ncbi:MAG TPA: FAD-dependent oxidoreductase [Clostridia bacterium]|nr:FAD-dependent oxidoreductase [Clostridia bacterium]
MEMYCSQIVKTLEADIAVVGAGSAGILAAVAAGKTGKKVILVEKNGFLGGISTAVLDTFNGFYAPGADSKIIVGGLPATVIERLIAKSAAIERSNTFGSGMVVTYNSEVLKCVYDDMINESEINVLFHSFCTDVVLEDNKINSIIIDTKQGLIKINAKIVIDASGDADVCCKAGVPFEKAGEIDVAQTLTTTFRLGNVNTEKALKVSRKELVELMKAANKSGKYILPREEGSIHITPVNGVMHAIMTKLNGYDPCDAVSKSAAEIEGRKQVLEYSRFLIDNVPGYEDAKLIYISPEIGVRETRRIYGEYRLTKDDVLSAAKFPDSIGLCAAPIEDHSKGKGTNWEFIAKDKAYDIPFRTLIPQKIEALLVAGRCFSATHDAHASCRSVAQTMTLGQAAGIAAALCVENKILPRYLSVKELQNKLIEQGAILSMD